MADYGHFDRLVSGLSSEERSNLFEKLKGAVAVSADALYVGEERGRVPAAEIKLEYARLPWYWRLAYFIIGFVKGVEPARIFGDRQVEALGGKIEAASPGLYDFQKALLLPAFYRQMEHLKEASRFFYSALDLSVSRDRAAFIAFLGSLEMPDVHKVLESETNPARIAEKNPAAAEGELRAAAQKAMEDAFLMISDVSRGVMYADARSLNFLKDLSSFLYDRVIMAFSFNSNYAGETCSTGLVRELLITLNNILFSFSAPPPMPLLQSLFAFALQDRQAEPGFNMSKEIKTLSDRAEEALKTIREFNRKVPLTWIIRCASRDMSYAPKETSGGEDWFVIFRDYWKRRVDALYFDFMKDKRRRELFSSFKYFLKGQSLRALENTSSGLNSEGLPVKGTFALSFIYTFYTALFMPEINKVLRPILIDGEFIRKENRVEFAESYNNLIKLEDDIKSFEAAISPNGDYGKRYAQARQDMSALPVKRRKIQIALDEASLEAGRIIEQTRDASKNMVNILGGILGRETRGRYESLSNLQKMAGKDNEFASLCADAAGKFQQLLKLLDDIEAMELGR